MPAPYYYQLYHNGPTALVIRFNRGLPEGQRKLFVEQLGEDVKHPRGTIKVSGTSFEVPLSEQYQGDGRRFQVLATSSG